MPTPTLTLPPISPSVARPSTFDAEADAHLAWQSVNVSEMVTFISWAADLANTVLANKNLTDTAVLAAASSADAAGGSATLAGEKADIATVKATAAAASATSALNAPGTRATSTTSLTIGTGIKTLTIQTGKLFSEGQTAVFADTTAPNLRQMYGIITSHNNVTGVISIDVLAGQTVGSGTVATWTVSLTGARGAQGPSAGVGLDVRTTDIPLNLADLGKLIERTSGSVQSLGLASVLGANWTAYIKNSTGANLTIDPSGSDLVAGLASYVIANGNTLHLQCNGLTFNVISEVTNPIKRLHILSAEAAAKYVVGGMLPIFDLTATIPSASAASERMMFTGSLFVVGPTRNTLFYATSPDGKVWTERYTGFDLHFNFPRNNGENMIFIPTSTPYRSSNGGLTFVAGAALGRVPTFAAYASSGTYLAGSANLCQVSTNNAVSFSADQTIPHNASNVFAVGATFVSYNIASGTYYTSTTGMTGSWTARTLPASIAAGTIWEDGSGGLVLVPTDVTKNLYGTSDGINWVDLGFNQGSLNYGGLSDGTKNAAAFVCPVKINGNWVLFNGASAGAGGAGAAVKYKGDTWVPMFVDVGGLANSVPTKLLVASSGAGVTVVRDAGATNKVHLINTTTTKCMGHFV